MFLSNIQHKNIQGGLWSTFIQQTFFICHGPGRELSIGNEQHQTITLYSHSAPSVCALEAGNKSKMKSGLLRLLEKR